MGKVIKVVLMLGCVGLVGLMLVAVCGGKQLDVADKIANEAKRLSIDAAVKIGGGRFVYVEVSATEARCMEVEAFARTLPDPPDCITVRCRLPDNSTRLLTSYQGSWQGDGGYFPDCAKSK